MVLALEESWEEMYELTPEATIPSLATTSDGVKAVG